MAGSSSSPTQRRLINDNTSHGGPAIPITLIASTAATPSSPISDSEHDQLTTKSQQCGLTDHIRKWIKQGRVTEPHTINQPVSIASAATDTIHACSAPPLLAAYFAYEMETTTYVLTPAEKCIFSQTMHPTHNMTATALLPLSNTSRGHSDGSSRVAVWCTDSVILSIVGATSYFIANHALTWTRA